MKQASHTRDIRSLVESVQAGQPAEYVLFWGHRPPKDRGVSAACFSQWYARTAEGCQGSHRRNLTPPRVGRAGSIESRV
jgi:hypothetical protein